MLSYAKWKLLNESLAGPRTLGLGYPTNLGVVGGAATSEARHKMKFMFGDEGGEGGDMPFKPKKKGLPMPKHGDEEGPDLDADMDGDDFHDPHGEEGGDEEGEDMGDMDDMGPEDDMPAPPPTKGGRMGGPNPDHVKGMMHMMHGMKKMLKGMSPEAGDVGDDDLEGMPMGDMGHDMGGDEGGDEDMGDMGHDMGGEEGGDEDMGGEEGGDEDMGDMGHDMGDEEGGEEGEKPSFGKKKSPFGDKKPSFGKKKSPFGKKGGKKGLPVEMDGGHEEEGGEHKCAQCSKMSHMKKKMKKEQAEPWTKEDAEFLRSLKNQLGATQFKVNKDGWTEYQEDALLPPTDPNAGVVEDDDEQVRQPRPGDIGFAPQGRVGDPLGGYEEWSKKYTTGRKLNENLRPRKKKPKNSKSWFGS